MRSSAVVGAMAGVLVALVVAAALVAAVLSEPSRATLPPAATDATGASPGTPTAPGAASATTGPTPSTAASASTSPQVGLRVGDRAPPLRVAQLGGGEIDTAALAGRPLWINFMATWCPPCREELPLMQRLQQQLGDRMLIVLIDVREDPDTVASFAGSLALELPVGLDQDGRAQRDWGAAVLPVHYWLDADGTVREWLYGGGGPGQLTDAVRTVLPDASLQP